MADAWRKKSGLTFVLTIPIIKCMICQHGNRRALTFRSIRSYHADVAAINDWEGSRARPEEPNGEQESRQSEPGQWTQLSPRHYHHSLTPPHRRACAGLAAKQNKGRLKRLSVPQCEKRFHRLRARPFLGLMKHLAVAGRVRTLSPCTAGQTLVRGRRVHYQPDGVEGAIDHEATMETKWVRPAAAAVAYAHRLDPYTVEHAKRVLADAARSRSKIAEVVVAEAENQILADQPGPLDLLVLALASEHQLQQAGRAGRLPAECVLTLLPPPDPGNHRSCHQLPNAPNSAGPTPRVVNQSAE